MPLDQPKRRRARPVFKVEEPVKVQRLAHGVGDLVEMLGLLGRRQKAKAARHLQAIASDLLTSRRQQAASISRSDANKTLLALAHSARELADMLDRLPPEALRQVHSFYDPSIMALEAAPGAPALFQLERAIEELNGATRAAILVVGRGELEEIAVKSAAMAFKLGTALSVASQMDLITTPGFATLLRVGIKTDGPVARLSDILGRLAQLAGAAARIAGISRGPKRDISLHFAVQVSARLWEGVGKKASHTAHAGRLYTGQAQSDFGEFVLAFMKLVEPGNRDRRGLLETITAVTWPSRQAATNRARNDDRYHAKVAQIVRDACLVTNYSHHMGVQAL